MKTLTSGELSYKCLIAFPNLRGLYVPDRDYNVAKRSWYEKFWKEFFKPFIDQHGLDYSSKFDCDNFATLFKALAHLAHARDVGKSEGLAIATFSFTQRSGGGHAICLIEGEDSLFDYFEPQTGEFIHLNQDEKTSARFVTF